VGFDVAVIGLGAVGSAAIHALAARGVSVIGFDAYDPPHAMGSSHGDTRLVRVAYAEGETYVPLARRAVDLWLDFNQTAGERLFHQAGVLYAGPDQGSMITSVRRSAERWSLALEGGRNIPDARIPEGWTVLFEPDGGYARPEAAIAFFLRGADLAGARLRRSTPVERLERTAGAWRIEAGGETVEADKVLVSAGGWTGRLRPALAPLLSIQRRVHTWFDPAGTDLAPGLHPAFAFQDETGCWFYGAPAVSGGRGVKLSPHHGDDPAAGPDQVDRRTSEADCERSRRFAARVLPGLGPVIDQEACFYTMSPDGHFIIEDAVADEGLLAVTGLSGHGFKFVPALGEHAAQRLCGESPGIDLSAFSPERFA
jgi:monomeric sarcosine oxidase